MPHVPTAYDEKLASILRRAAIIFAEKGYHQASVRDIARATGISLSGLYYYFDSKEELLFLIQDYAMERLVDSAERLLSGVADPHRRLRLLIENHLRFFVNNMAEMKVLSHEAESLSGKYRAPVAQKKRHLTALATSILAELRPGSDLDPRVSVFVLFGMMNWLYNWYRPDRDVPVGRLAEEMNRIFLCGFLHDPDALPDVMRESVSGEIAPSMWATVADPSTGTGAALPPPGGRAR